MIREESPDVVVPFVKDAMRRDRFYKIVQFLHLADNNAIDDDRF
jgi:hypothetical protein